MMIPETIRDFWLFRTTKVLVATLVLLCALGAALRPLQSPVWEQIRNSQPELNLKGVEGALGQGLVIGLFGGFRTIVADFLFIQANVHWEKKDRPKTETMLKVVTEIDPRPMFFWLNGARMVAYDIPVWRIQEMGGFDAVPGVVQEQIKKEQVERALGMLNRAEKFHPDDYRIPLERAQLYYNRLNDVEQSAYWYKVTTEYENAPYFAGRIYAQHLRSLGKTLEAYNFLRSIYPALPKDDPTATVYIILQRIREMEEELQLPEMARFPVQPEERFN